MSAREHRAKTRKRARTTVRRVTGSTAVAATAAIGLAGPILSTAEAAVAGTATQLKNINTVAQGSNPTDLTTVGGTLYYAADSLANGQELWKSTGTNGTQVADLVNGSQGSYPTDLTNANGHLFFFAENAEGQYQLWTSNGSAAGTTPLTNLPGLPQSGLVNVGNNVSFLVDSNNNTELWTSNGTVNGTTDAVLTNIAYGDDLTAAGGDLYFAAYGNTANTDSDQFLWTSNGTVAGTSEVTPSITGNSTGNGAYYSIDGIEAVGSDVYFAASNTGDGDQVYGASNGLGVSSYQVSNFPNGTAVTNLASNGSDVFFETQNSANGAAQLWDGTIGVIPGLNPSDTALANLATDSTNGLVNPYLTNVNGEMYFAAENAGSTELFHSNGAASGTNVVDVAVTNVADLTNANSTLYFSAGNGSGGLWTSNGTANGTTEVANSGPLANLASFANLGSTLYFSASSPLAGSHLWSTSANGVSEVDANVDAADNAGSYPTGFTAVGANVFFAATSANGPSVFVSNGVSGGTSALANGVVATDLVNDNGNLAFLGESNNGANATEQLWVSNGTGGAGTHAVALNVGANLTDLTNVNGELYFEANGLANNTTNQVQLWETNGTQAGTSQLTSFSNQFVGPEQGGTITNAGSEAYFVVNADGPAELYQSNGTAAGTFATNGAAAPSESYIADLTPAGGELYYVTASVTGEALWVTNGTAAGTTELVSGAFASYLTNVNGTLFFTEESTSGYALWSSAGTVASTHVVKSGIEPETLVGDGSELYFTTYAPATNSTSLWESNGTSAGTTVFANIAGYTGSSLTNDDGALAFADSDGVHGLELWTSNGTSAGTGIVADIWPGAHSGLYSTSGGGGGFDSPDFTNDGSNLFFAADDGVDGVEPWVANGLSPVVAPSTGTPTTTPTTTTTTTPTPTRTTPTPTPTKTVTTTTPTLKASVLKLSRFSVSGDSLTLKLTCSAGTGNCVTTGKVEIVETIKHNKIVALTAVVEPRTATKTKKKTIVLVSKKATIKAGTTGTLKLTLDKTGQRLLTAHKTLKVELLVTQGTKKIAGKTVRLTAPKAKKKTTKK